MSRISLVISDVDGSLVTHDKRLTEAAIEAVKVLNKNNIGFTITSSRPAFGMRMLIEPLGLRLPFGAFNGSLIVDVSCDAGMGFSWARPTSFAEPMFEVGDHIRYYGVDHTPSYLWDSASWEVSEALLPFLETVMSGPAAWALDEPIDHAIEIHDGVIINPAILEFQERSATYPHHGVK